MTGLHSIASWTVLCSSLRAAQADVVLQNPHVKVVLSEEALFWTGARPSDASIDLGAFEGR